MFYSSENEKSMIYALGDKLVENPEEELIFYFSNGDIYWARVYTLYESDNGYEMDEDEYVEYYACVVRVSKVVALNSTGEYKPTVGRLQELGYKNIPEKICRTDNSVLWKKKPE